MAYRDESLAEEVGSAAAVRQRGSTCVNCLGWALEVVSPGQAIGKHALGAPSLLVARDVGHIRQPSCMHLQWPNDTSEATLVLC